jgi:hypothetical protein
LRLDPPLEFLVQSFDRIGGAYAAPLARRQAGEGEEAVVGFLQAVGNGTILRMKALRRIAISSGVAV